MPSSVNCETESPEHAGHWFTRVSEDCVRKVFLSACLLTLCLPVFAKNAAELMKDLTQVLPNESLPLSLLYLSDTTLPLMFQPPDLYVMRARARENSQF